MLVGGLVPVDGGAVQGEKIVREVDSHPHRTKEAGHRRDVAEVGGVAQMGCSGTEYGGRHQGKRRVLRTAHRDRSAETSPPLYDELVHFLYWRVMFERRMSAKIEGKSILILDDAGAIFLHDVLQGPSLRRDRANSVLSPRTPRPGQRRG